MGCDMTLDEAIRAVLATEALGSDRGQEFPARMFGLAQHILDTPAKRWDRRSVAAAGILEGLRRGDRQRVGHQLRRYWDRHLKPEPEPEPEWQTMHTGRGFSVRTYAPALRIEPGEREVRFIEEHSDGSKRVFRVSIAPSCECHRLVTQSRKGVHSDDS